MQSKAVALYTHFIFGEVATKQLMSWQGKSWSGLPSKGGIAFSAALEVYQSDWKRLQQAIPTRYILSQVILIRDLSGDTAASDPLLNLNFNFPTRVEPVKARASTSSTLVGQITKQLCSRVLA